MDVTKKNGVPTTLEYWNGSSSTVFLSNGNSSWVGIDFQWLIPLESIHSKLKWVFSFHAYFFGCTFFILAFYTFSSILNIRSQISRKRFMSGINTFLCIFGLSRAASLFIDPYGSLKVLPVPITNAIWAIGFPSLTSSFCLLQLAFLHLTKLKYGLKLLRIEIFLRTVITLHIFSSVLRAVISSLHWSLNIVVINYICELVFLSWALFLHVSFLYIGYKVFGLLNRVPATMLQPDGCQSKGIMQLVMLAPASNLVTSVTAALMPTLLGPAANIATKATAENTANKSTTIKQGASGLGGSEKKESDDVSPSSSSSKLNQLNRKKIKSIDEIKIEEKSKSSPQEGPKLKKLTWQSSITNGNKTESSITGPRMSNAAKRPILKESNKKDNPKIEITPEIVPASAKEKEPPVVVNVDNNDKVNKENDILLHTILNHIAYVNRASGGSDSGFAHCTHDATPTSRKKQVRFVLKITYATAILGFCLTLGEFFQKFGPYGLMKYYISNDDEIEPWPWFIFQTVCRSFEILMSGAIANITKQPAANVHRYYKYNPAIMKQRGSMFM